MNNAKFPSWTCKRCGETLEASGPLWLAIDINKHQLLVHNRITIITGEDVVAEDFSGLLEYETYKPWPSNWKAKAKVSKATFSDYDRLLMKGMMIDWGAS